MRSTLVDIIAILVHETDKARLFKFDEDKENVWIPKSQHEWDEDTKMVTMEQSLAEEKGIV
jgi:hypothetical protein